MMQRLSVSILGLCVSLSVPVDGGQALLERARTAVGGDALRQVRSLEVDFAREGAGMDFLLPDRFRLRTGAVQRLFFSG